MLSWALQVVAGSSKASPVRSPSVAWKVRPRLTRSGRPVKRALPSALVAEFEVEFVKTSEPVGDVNTYFRGVDGISGCVGDGEVGGAGSGSAVEDGDSFGVGGWSLGKGGGR